ncbi:MFS transporter [Brucella tritici]|uniref:MFS transporter n=1 Tax=Brucella tritici TaxID=94626 RepID=UPI0015925888
MNKMERIDKAPSPVAVFATISGLYIAQSVIGGMTWTGLPAIMRDNGVSLDQIGLVSLIILPWALKFLWAPTVERFRLPPAGRTRTATIILGGGFLSVLCLLVIGFIDPGQVYLLLGILAVVAFATATVDIACDGYAVQSLSPENYGWGNAAQVGGAYLGSAIGAGAFLILVDRFGWHIAIWTMAAVLVMLGLPFAFLSRGRDTAEDRSHTPSLLAAWRRPEIRRGLAAAAVYVIAQKTGLAMLGPFLIDAGLDLTTVGILNGAGSMFLGLAAALAGGGLVRAFGVRSILAAALLLQAFCFLFFALHSADKNAGIALIAVAVISSSGVVALGFVALYAQFMHWSDPKQAGVDFTLFQCMDALVSMAGGVASGFLAQHFGYGPFFAGFGAIAIFAAPLMWKLCRPKVTN